MIYNLLWTMIGLTFGLTIGKFLPTYFSKKGENLATKEDISEITKMIESIKHEYSNNLESFKAELSAKLNTHGFRYENEFSILNEPTGLLVDVRDSSVNLRPAFDFNEPNKDGSTIKQERLSRLWDARRALYLARERKRPFFPNDIYQAILNIEKTVHIESVKYQYQSPFDGDNFIKYWEEAEKNQNEITNAAEKAMHIIRTRVNKWESLNNM